MADRHRHRFRRAHADRRPARRLLARSPRTSSAPSPSRPRSSAPASPATPSSEVLMGNCLMAGQGQAPARQAALGAGLPQSAGAVTLSKMCGSGMRAMMFAHDMLKAESAEIVVAGGMESMTNAPHLTFVRKGVRYGAAAALDHMAIDGLEDAYEPTAGKAMGVFAEQCVAKYKFTPRGDGPVRDRLDRALRRRPTRTAASTGRWRRSRVPGKAGDTVDQVRRAAVQGQARQDPGPQARVQEGRHDHRRHLVEHLRRRRRAGADARVDGDAPRRRSRSRASSPTRCMRRRRTGSRRRRSARSRRC